MKASELMIGNVFREKTTCEIIEVYYLKEGLIGFTGDFTHGWQAVPIRLTAEILIKSNARKIAKDHYRIKVNQRGFINIYLHGDLKPECELSTRGGYSFGYYDIEYFHQLQNLVFTLTGKELHYGKK